MAIPITKPTEPAEVDNSGKKRMRSPAYPYMNLETAIRRSKEFHDREVRGLAYMRVAAKHWGYEEKSSGALQTAAALISFGLMRDEGTGAKRKLQLTQTALRIILDTRTDSSERGAAIKQAALSPKIHKELWRRFGPNVSNEQLRHTLILDWTPPFNEKSVDGFIKEYRDTIAFAKLSESDTLATEDGNNEDIDGASYVPQVGDYVQWESQGQQQFKEPVKVLSLSSDRTHAFVAETRTGLPVTQLTHVKAPPKITQSEPRPTLPQTTVKEDVYSIDEGRVVVQWPASLSAESVEDIKRYLKLLEGKIERCVVKEEPA